MKKSSIIAIIIGLALIVTSCVMVQLEGTNILESIQDFSESKSTKEEKLLKVGKFTKIVIDSNNDNIKIIPNSDTENVKVEYYTSDRIQFDIGIVNSELYIKQQIDSSFGSWFDFNFGDNGVIVHIPINLSLTYEINGSNGEIIFDRVDVDKVDAHTSNAEIRFSEVKANDRLTLETSNAKIALDKVVSHNDIDVTTSNGLLNMSEVKTNTMWAKTSNGAIRLTEIAAYKVWAKTSNGSIELDRLSANDITLNTSNASIKGSIIGKYDDFSKDIKTSNGEIRIDDTEYGKRVSSSVGEKALIVDTSNAGIDIRFNKN